MPLTDEQRQWRRKYLGASDTPVILGLSPYKITPGDIYWSKVADTVDDKTASKETGNWLEEPLVEWAAKEIGSGIKKGVQHVKPHDIGANILACTHDALCLDELSGIEAKYVSRNNPHYDHWGKAGTDQVPADVVAQCQHQMFVSDLSRVWVPAAYEASTLERRLYVVNRDEIAIGQITTLALAWWEKHVLRQVPPADAPIPPIQALKAIARAPGLVVELTADIATTVNVYRKVNEAIKELEAQKEQWKAELIHALADAEIGVLPDGARVTYKSQNSAPSVNSTLFKAEAPDLYERCVHQGTHRVLRISAAPKN